MAWPVDLFEDGDPPESAEENVTSSTDSLNGSPNVYAQGAAGINLPNPPNLRDTRDRRVPNPYINRIRNVRRYSLSDIPQSNAQQPSRNDSDNGQRHSISRFGNGRRYSLQEISQSNAHRASASNESNFSQRHSYPCCHMNPNMLHSCCLHLKRHLSLENLTSHRRHSLPQNYFHDSYNRDISFGRTISHTILNPHAYENPSAFGEIAEYERQHSFSVSQSLLFGNENFQADSCVQQAVADVGPEFFMRFLADEMERRGLYLPEDMCRHMVQIREMPQPFIYLIDRFSSSLEREMIYFLAQRVQFPLSWSCFVAIVDGMNKGTTSPERLVTLLFFCADLAIRALREGNDALFHEIVSWTQWYLRSRNTMVVVPSKRSSYKIAATACFVGIIAVLFLMKRN